MKKGDSIVADECNVTPWSGKADVFTGAVALYIKKDNRFFNEDGREVSVPPEISPQFRDVFQTK